MAAGQFDPGFFLILLIDSFVRIVPKVVLVAHKLVTNDYHQIIIDHRLMTT